MSTFTHFSAFSRINNTNQYRLHAPLTWCIGSKTSEWHLTIPKNTTFDLSIPWFAQWLLSPHDRQLLPAAAVHDELLRRKFDVAFASAEFRRAVRARGVSPFWGWLLYLSTLLWTLRR